MSAIKRLALRFLTNPIVLRGVEYTTRGAAAILTLHRFTAYGRSGHDPDALARNLEWLRRHRYRMIPLMELIEQMQNREPLSPRTVAFTVDDGYADFAEVGAPVFQRYDCPVTVFLITGFLDGGLWLWWDRIRFALEQTTRREVEFPFSARPVRYEWNDLLGRLRVGRDLIRRFKALPNPEREAAHVTLEERLEVVRPERPPTEFGPMTWEQVRALGLQGVTFGPHTVTHPILARTSDEQSRNEIRESWHRLTQEQPGALPVFCWPNGDPTSFGNREVRNAADAGMVAALSTVQTACTRRHWSNDGGRFALPRYAYPQDASGFAQVVSGLERLKEIARFDLMSSSSS